NNTKNDWWAWEQMGKVETGEVSGKSTDHWNRFQEDLDLAAQMGLNAYRFSIEWSRWQPYPDQWDPVAIDWYRQLIDECEKRKLKPMVTLHHFTSPLWFAERGGFLNPDSPTLFLKFVKKVISELGDRISLWCTFNEPMVLAVGQYLGGFMPPGEFKPDCVGKLCHHILKSHVQSYDAIHRETKKRNGPWREEPIEVGIANNMIDFFPGRSWHPIDIGLSKVARNFFNRTWWDALTGRPQSFGLPWLIKKPPQVLEALGRRTCDYLGINYYTKGYLSWGSLTQVQADFPIQVKFAKETEPKSELGWAIHPEGLGRMMRFAQTYQLPVYITENGIADATDKYRGQYLISHLKQVAEAISQGVQVKGYFHWSLIDNFEWIKGYEPRFGLAQVDYSNFQRGLRPSARLFSKIIAMHQGYFDQPQIAILNSFTHEQK
ncbi:MAG: glycoside hydrolase family 1 protein, partial [Deltaproteobacteria bacterium]